MPVLPAQPRSARAEANTARQFAMISLVACAAAKPRGKRMNSTSLRVFRKGLTVG